MANTDPSKGPVFRPSKTDYKETFTKGAKDSKDRTQYETGVGQREEFDCREEPTICPEHCSEHCQPGSSQSSKNDNRIRVAQACVLSPVLCCCRLCFLLGGRRKHIIDSRCA